MGMKHSLAFSLILLLAVAGPAAANEVADAAMNRDLEAVRSLLDQKATETGLAVDRLRDFLDYINAPQIDGTTAIHWAVNHNDFETTCPQATARASHPCAWPPSMAAWP